MTREQTGCLLRQQLGLLVDAGVGHLRQVHPRKGAGGVDHEQRRRVVDLPMLDRHVDVV